MKRRKKLLEDLLTNALILVMFASAMIGFVGAFLSKSTVFPCMVVAVISSIVTAAAVVELD